MKKPIFIFIIILSLSFLIEGKEFVHAKKNALADSTKNKTDTIRSRILEEFVVKAIPQIENNNGRLSISVERLKLLPQAGGEKDILRSLLVLPGLQPSNESQAGYFVRGGSIDQNLVMMDGVPIYGTGHVLNFISVFNMEAIGGIDFYKGGFNSQYGGRLSSVLDVKLKEGKTKLHQNVSIGLITSKYLIEGPLGRKGGSFIVNARNASLVPVTLLLSRDYYDESVKDAQLYGFNLADLSAKVQLPLKKNQKISFFAHSSFDSIMNGERSNTNNNRNRFRYFNFASGATYSNRISERLDIDVKLAVTSNSYADDQRNVVFERVVKESNWLGTDIIISDVSFVPIDTLRPQSKSGVLEALGGLNLHYQINNNNRLDAGIGLSQRYFSPLISETYGNAKNEMAQEANAYVHHTVGLGSFTVNSGARLAYFKNQTFGNAQLDPRISLSYTLNSTQKIGFAVDRMHQFAHAIIQGVDFYDRVAWLPSTAIVKPEVAWQYTTGFYHFDKRNRLSFSSEVYYKTLQNQLFYPTSADDKRILIEWENRLRTNGTGHGYGLELMAAKNWEQLGVQAGYTLSYAIRNFKNLNQGKDFFFPFDRRHNFNVVGTYEITHKWNFSAMFVLMTGRRVNLPNRQVLGNFYMQSFELNSGYYNYVLPATHRLDLSADYKFKNRHGKDASWNFSLYNAYFKRNIYAAKLAYRGSEGVPYVINRGVNFLSLLPIVPSVAYSFDI